MLFSCMESNLFLTGFITKHQETIHLMLALITIRCSVALTQNEEEAAATRLLNFCIRENVGSIRDAKYMEEFVKVVKEFEIPMKKSF